MAESVGMRKRTRSGSKCGEDEGRESKKQRTVHFSVSRKYLLLAELFLLFDWKYFGVEISRRTTCRRRADDLRMTCR